MNVEEQPQRSEFKVIALKKRCVCVCVLLIVFNFMLFSKKLTKSVVWMELIQSFGLQILCCVCMEWNRFDLPASLFYSISLSLCKIFCYVQFN